MRFPPEVIQKLRYYVYLYLDPDTDEVFYVGKGRGNRVFNHLKDTSESEKTDRIKEIRRRGKEPKTVRAYFSKNNQNPIRYVNI